MNENEEPAEAPPRKTHRDLLPPDMCGALMMKQILTHAMDDEVHDGRQYPGDGYYWCQRTCKEVGPDDELCHPATCNPSRACCTVPATRPTRIPASS
jgi:hypothetical protein